MCDKCSFLSYGGVKSTEIIFFGHFCANFRTYYNGMRGKDYASFIKTKINSKKYALRYVTHIKNDFLQTDKIGKKYWSKSRIRVSEQIIVNKNLRCNRTK